MSIPWAIALFLSMHLLYNYIMKIIQSCSTSRVTMWIRIILSLLIMILGIIHRNPFGFLGILTLINALRGTCPMTLSFNYHSEKNDGN